MSFFLFNELKILNSIFSIVKVISLFLLGITNLFSSLVNCNLVSSLIFPLFINSKCSILYFKLSFLKLLLFSFSSLCLRFFSFFLFPIKLIIIFSSSWIKLLNSLTFLSFILSFPLIWTSIIFISYLTFSFNFFSKINLLSFNILTLQI